MKSQITHNAKVVTVQPQTTFHKNNRMKNPGQIHFASSRRVCTHRFSLFVVLAMSIVLLASICSAQTSTYIPQYAGLGMQDSIMNQPNGTRINVNNGDLNLTNFGTGYRIGGKYVLKATDFPGSGAMRSLSIGIGAGSISSTLSGTGSNTFVGAGAASLNTNSAANTMVGDEAGYKNTTGGWNVCMGSGACFSNSVSTGNTMLGTYSGFNTTGGSNTFLGIGAGGNTTTGSSNIYIGPNAQGAPGESNTIRIGVQGTGSGQQKNAYMAGIYGNSSVGIATYFVCIGTDGHLYQAPAGAFCSPSSRRFKNQIADMGDSSSKLFQLHPVTFFYKPESDDGSHALQYGLIAEEVAKVYPEMVAYEKDGQPYTVRYQMLAPKLLNELQKQHGVVVRLQSELQTEVQLISAQREEIDGLKLQLQQQNVSLQERLTKLESYVATQMKLASDNAPMITSVNRGQ